MPEMTFDVRWPDGSRTSCYSPSLVMHDFLTAGHSYPVPEFAARAGEALRIAGDRVQAAYGMRCTSAEQQLTAILRLAGSFAEGEVTVERMHPPLPANTAPGGGSTWDGGLAPAGEVRPEEKQSPAGAQGSSGAQSPGGGHPAGEPGPAHLDGTRRGARA